MNASDWIKDPIVTIRKPFNRLNEADKDQLITNRCDDWRFEDDDFYLVDVNAVTGPAADLELMSDALHSENPRQPVERNIRQLQNDKQFSRNMGFIMGGAAVLGMPMVGKTVWDEAKLSPQTPVINYAMEAIVIAVTFFMLKAAHKSGKSFFKTKKELTEKKIIVEDIQDELKIIVADRIITLEKDRETNEYCAPV